MPYLMPRTPEIAAGIQEFGRALRHARLSMGKTQRRLAEQTEVSQSVISRAERGLAPRLALERMVQIQRALRPALPLGQCPHDHECRWREELPKRQRAGAG